MSYDRGKTITFPAGLPGLPAEMTAFELVAVAEESPFFFLQSLQDENIGFILVNPFAFFPNYEFDLREEDARALGIKVPEEAAVFCIVNASRGLAHATVNLLAPVVVNAATGTARQVVLVDERYSIRHPLFGPRPENRDPAGPKTKPTGEPCPPANSRSQSQPCSPKRPQLQQDSPPRHLSETGSGSPSGDAGTGEGAEPAGEGK
ncbi:flagellar assembly protein FliW [Desulfofundulus thermosubterraneus]|uniref:Flagellar assembly factor FliW n=1 Tax=Desulfofundulus thermosubterraneus DSM 16057 TaxID=1121432 RepID=A0A1M6K1V6_9FIRM|nr:flagellar assembly protein FliW [Desulfofundulus thermosubterraneus]SHJ52949.1 flagellar assembly factor FliW [Desulfofundulus thermosubterraneus DSM 16057]